MADTSAAVASAAATEATLLRASSSSANAPRLKHCTHTRFGAPVRLDSRN